MLEIVNLDSEPQYFENVFNSIFGEWGENNHNYWKSWIKSSIKATGIPSTYVVLKNKEYVGTFSFWNCDMQSRQDLFPWLGGIVVVPDYRGQGIGLFIQEQAKKILKKERIEQAYLFTELTGFYEKTGWTFVEEIYNEKDKLVRLYRLCL